ncbi:MULTISPECIES: bacitracin resistance protein [unclassified Microbacterium]|uniref:bacitracin resistance protein n=1 Tax=unclassified Microbacterium TaxID=2609290 RepID=UPI00214ACF52|nr:MULTISPECIES: bacitracin resistance protein [unclassified Microbacterium]MCR2809315.1 bacitracin resistance protein [Microbacterium sp. zg.B185]WIM20455.1 bacitracin resistance protein [Microbacterium sp. zg-B185]
MIRRTAEGTGSRVRAMPTWLVATIAGALGLFYAYAVWNAVGNLVQAAPLGLNGLGWFIWIFAILFPVIVWGAAFAAGYKRRPHEFLLVMLSGLGLVAVFWLNVVAYTTLNTASLLG